MPHVIESTFQTPLFSPDQFPFTMHCDRLSIDYRVLPHWHEEIEILYFNSGSACAICNHEKLLCRAGDILFINSFCFHSLDNVTEFCTYYCLFVGIDILKLFHLSPANLPPYCLTTDPHVEYAAKTIVEEHEKCLINYQPIIEAQLLSTLTYITRIASTSANTPIRQSYRNQSSKMRQAIEFINENLTQKIFLTDLCDVTQLSPSRFSSIFKMYTGKTLVDYINLARCEYARNLFLTGKYSVTDCAEKAGYNNMPYFARKYRQIYGITLSQTQSNNRPVR